MDPRRAPARVRLRHRANQGPDVGGHRRSAESASTLPGPPEPEALSVPGDDGLRLHEDQRRSPSGPDARQHDPEPPVRPREPDSLRSRALQHVKLVPQGQDFEVERRARTRQRSEVSRSERSTETMAAKRTHGRSQHQLPQQERTFQ